MIRRPPRSTLFPSTPLFRSVMPARLAEPMTTLVINNVSCTATFVQYAGLAALTGSQEPVTRMVSGLRARSEEHTSELQSPCNLVCRLLLEKKKTDIPRTTPRLRQPPRIRQRIVERFDARDHPPLPEGRSQFRFFFQQEPVLCIEGTHHPMQ